MGDDEGIEATIAAPAAAAVADPDLAPVAVAITKGDETLRSSDDSNS